VRSGRATDREPCRPRSATANDAPVFGLGRSEVLSAGDRRVRYNAPDNARKATAGDCLSVGDQRSWTATCRNRHDRHRARLDKLEQCTLANSHMPAHMDKLNSTLKRLGA
jgi:hypothetical protein